ncbi:hypothetical protein ACL2XP_22830 [Sodalis sp. RH21]
MLTVIRPSVQIYGVIIIVLSLLAIALALANRQRMRVSRLSSCATK